MSSSQLSDTFSLLTWNLDGLDSSYLQQRTEFVIDLVEKSNHSVIFFQELIPATFRLIVSRLKTKFLAIAGTDDPSVTQYFTATFLRIDHVEHLYSEIINFKGTTMDRNMLVTGCCIDQNKFVFINTHLESTAAYTKERINQLTSCFDYFVSVAPEWNVIFGGDLNLRDHEVSGKMPSNVCDIWEKCGSPLDCKYTWDLTRNTNKQMPSAKQPKCRFDRLYFRESTPAKIQPNSFGLTGVDKLAEINYFGSDHWGIVVSFRSAISAQICK